MAIVFNCPHCAEAYNLKDEYAGKKATCKNKTCRKVITIPQPGTATLKPGDTPPPAEPIDVEAAALSALADSPAETAGPQTVPMTCEFCGHKWTEPLAKAGKNVLCPNPECRQRMKVPVPKGSAPVDWRTGGQQGPSLAKENFEKPTDIMDAGSAGIVGGGALKKAGATNEEYEPIPLKKKVMFVLVPLTVLAVLVGIGWYWWGMRRESKQNQLMSDALKEWAEKVDEGSKPPAPQVPLYEALLHIVAGEHTLRDVDNHNDPKKHLPKAHAYFTQAREQLRQAAQKDPSQTATAERNLLLAELAAATLLLGGTDEQVKDETRYRWLPDTTPGKHARIRDTDVNVQGELRRTFDLLRTADFDSKAALARRLTRELVKRGQANLAIESFHTMLFEPAEQPEARAIVALEVYRLDRGSSLLADVANQLKPAASGRGLYPFPASATTLWKVLGTPDADAVGDPPSGQVGDQSCRAYTGVYLLQDKPDEALQLALRAERPETRMRALALCADWASDPGPVVDAAVAQVSQLSKKKDVTLPPAPILRLIQRAAEAGKVDQAKALVDGLTDEGLKGWARSEVVVSRLRAASPKEPADEATAEVPDDPRAMRVGHARARLAVARQNARVSGSRSPAPVLAWPAAIRPFGLAGIALGLQDRDAQ